LIQAVWEELRASAFFGPVFDPAITDVEERDFSVPALRFQLISNVESQNYEASLLQFNVWTNSKVQQVEAEAELRKLFHRDVPYGIQGVEVYSRYEGRSRLEGPQDGIQGVALDYHFEQIRSRYAPVSASSS
jgi:hypothetical protein